MDNKRQATIADRIKEGLKIKGMRQADLCKLARIPKSSLSLYLSGAYEPKQDRIYLISKALNVSEAWLMGFDVPMERENTRRAHSMEVHSIARTALAEPTLTEAEQLLLDLFRQIPEEKQQLFLQMGRLYADSLKKD
jgi:transcriptional regulator with XRE-family HTH domain